MRSKYLLLALALLLSAPSALCNASQRQTLCLNGEWDFYGGGSDEVAPDDGWVKIRVPGSWGVYCADEMDVPKEMQEASAAWYRLRFHLPREWNDGRLVKLVFDGINFKSRIWLNGNALEMLGARKDDPFAAKRVSWWRNGKPVGTFEGSHLPIEIDLTHDGLFGQTNQVLLRVRAGSRTPPVDEQEVSRFTGVWKDVHLDSLPRVHVDNTFVITSVRQKKLTARVWVTNQSRKPCKVVLRSQVMDGEKPVLLLPEQSVQLGVLGERELIAAKPWANPILWGFEPYGKPHLYWLRTEVVDSSGKVLDRTHTRFGFREFWTQGTKFVLNGKEIFLKGDLYSDGPTLINNRQFQTQFYLAERGANINFIRMHMTTDFAQKNWFEVADELGMLIETQQNFRWERGPEHHQRTLANWKSWIPRHWNHPSIVMYSADNEEFSQRDFRQPEVDMMPESCAAAQDVQDLIQSLDPTRPIEWQGDVRLGTAVKKGWFSGLQVWNAHPYGNPLGKDLEHLKKTFDYPGGIPIHVGEVYVELLNDFFSRFGSPAEMVRQNEAAFNLCDRTGKYLHDSILSVQEHGASGASLCAGMSELYYGPPSISQPATGPWDISQEEMHYESPGLRTGEGRNVNRKKMEVRWPSLSGEGMKVKWQRTNPGWGWDSNFHDPTRPPYVPSVAYDWVKRAFKQVDGKNAGPLAKTRAPEVIAVVSKDGKAAGGVYVYCQPAGNQPYDGQGMWADANGTAWFVLPMPGRYRVSCPELNLEKVLQVRVVPLEAEAGYGHIQWVDLGGNRSANIRKSLEGPAPFIIYEEMANPQTRSADMVAAQPAAPFSPGPFDVGVDGFLRHWLVCGPLPNLGDRVSGYQGYMTDWLRDFGGESGVVPQYDMEVPVTFPESDRWKAGPTRLKWRDLHAGDMVSMVDLLLPEIGISTRPPEYVVGYAASWVTSPEDVDCEVGIGSDDSHKVWVNGNLVGEKAENSAAVPDKYKYKARLNKGTNFVLVKVDQTWGDWCFYLRFLKDGKPVQGLRQSLVK